MKKFIVLCAALASFSALTAMEKDAKQSADAAQQQAIATITKYVNIQELLSKVAGIIAAAGTSSKPVTTNGMLKELTEALIEQTTLDQLPVTLGDSTLTLDELCELNELKSLLKRITNQVFNPSKLPIRTVLINYVQSFKYVWNLDKIQQLVDPSQKVKIAEVFEQIIAALKSGKVDSLKKVIDLEKLTKEAPRFCILFNLELLCSLADKAIAGQPVNGYVWSYALLISPLLQLTGNQLLTPEVVAQLATYSGGFSGNTLSFFTKVQALRELVTRFCDLPTLLSFLESIKADKSFDQALLVKSINFKPLFETVAKNPAAAQDCNAIVHHFIVLMLKLFAQEPQPATK